MPRLERREDYTLISERQIAGSGLGTSPEAIAAYNDLQRAVYDDQPADTADVQAAADAAQTSAAGAQDTADGAVEYATMAQMSADDAQQRADDAYDLAGTKVTKNVGLAWVAPAAAPSRAALPAYAGGPASATYDAVEVTALKVQVAALTAALAAVIVDGRANGSLTA